MPIASGKTQSRGPSRFEETNAKLLKLVTILEPRFSKQQIADELGISVEHLGNLVRGHHKTSRVIDRAAEGLLRRFGEKEPRSGNDFIVARIKNLHWPTISILIRDLRGEIIDEFTVLLTDDEQSEVADFTVAIFSISSNHSPAVTQLIISTGGSIRKEVPWS